MARTGDKMTVKEAALFWSNVDTSDRLGCWNWRRPGKHAYGRFVFRGKGRQAHRHAWEHWNQKPMPAHLNACHHCDNKMCCNPDHIYAGTQAENMQDFSNGVTEAGGRDAYMEEQNKNRPKRGIDTNFDTPEDGRGVGLDV